MTLSTVQFKPGVFSDETPYGAEGTWINSNLVRFVDGDPEALGGWERFGAPSFRGVPRHAHVWTTIDGKNLVAVGSHRKLQILAFGSLHDVTPIRASGTLSDPFTTIGGSAFVAVSHVAHGCKPGDVVIFASATEVGGLTLNGEFIVSSVATPDVFSFEAGVPATSSGTGGGENISYQYQVSIGPASATPWYGYGAGGYGRGGYGTAVASTELLQIGTWTFDNWGEDLLCCPRGGPIAHWSAAEGTDKRAKIIPTAPTASAIIVSPDDRHVIALGADGDPLKIRWCDQENFTNWTPGATSTADERRLLHGSRIIAGQRTTGEIVIWTDAALYSLQYTGGSFIFNLRRVGESGGLIGLHAKTEVNGAVYWMGQGQFYRYDGRIQVVPCPVRRTVFDAFDPQQADKVYCGTVSGFSEVVWFYPDKAGHVRYAKFKFTSGEWDIGVLDRSVWVDSDIFPMPLALSSDGTLYRHETGQTADGQPMDSWIESGDFDMGDGDDLMFLRRIVIDGRIGGTLDVTVRGRQYPNAPQIEDGPHEAAPDTMQVFPRLRARQMSIRIGASASAAVSDWRLGRLRVDIRPNGKR